MKRRSILAVALAAATAPVRANPANGDPRLEKLYSAFIAPCCWQGNLLNHSSPTADELRADIRRRVAIGETDDQIKRDYQAAYSLRILAEPDGGRGQLLTWTPVVAAVAALGFVVLLLRRMVGRRVEDTGELAPLPDVDWE